MSAVRWGAIARVAFVGLLALAGACKSTKARTEVMLEIDADDAVRAKLDALVILIDVSDDDGKSWEKRLTKSFDREAVGNWRAFDWPARLGLVPDGDNTDRRFAVRVQALDANGALYVWQQAVAGFERGRTQVLRMRLTESCMVDALDCGDPQCVGTEDEQDCETCRSGECVGVELLTLEDFDPRVLGDGGTSGDGGMDVDRDGGHDKPDAGKRDAGAHDAGGDAAMDSGAPPEDGGNDAGDTGDAGGDALVPLGFHVTDTTPTADDPVQDDTHGRLGVTFSDPVDQATVTGVTVTVSGDGRPIAGTVAASARGATFTPSEPWALASKYTLSVSKSVKSAMNEALEPFSFDFTVRDGVWSRKAEFDGLGDPQLALSSDGYGVLEWTFDTGGTPEIRASNYNPNTGFSAFVPLSTQGTGTVTAAANARHSAIAVWSGISAGQNVSLYSTTAGWTTGYGVSPGADAAVFLSDTDEIFYVASSTANSNQLNGYQYTLGAANPALTLVGGSASGNTDTQLVVLGGVARLAWIHSEGGSTNQILTGLLDPTLGVGLSNASLHASNLAFASTRTHASAILVWQQDDPALIGDDSIWASRVTTAGTWSAPVQISKGSAQATSPAISLDDHGRAVATWQQSGALKSTSFDPASGWAANPVTISAAGAMNPDPAQVALAPEGSGIAVWTQDSASMSLNEVWFARYLVGSGWQAASVARISDIEAGTGSVVTVAVDAAGRALAGWYQSNKIWIGRFE